ncbi:hypothetical protein GCM10025864_06190 [Luteimicrobium album]|uniref:Integral membrane bound transporter domain-containing protein n=1 Tax=Luteimicrobium album TaxID=1054550 RepID=A0ABQ6HZ98_9MICO|nr:FUSC family protein [Luteimicrobium album]GMA22860.1 hypothetical protein GCM10025864_06190 [Luteimicrobium album]
MGLSGAVCVAVALIAEYLVAEGTGAGPQGATVLMLLGSVVAMMGSNALAGHEVAWNVRAAAFFPVAMGVGFLAGVLVSGNHLLTLATFVAVMFLAVYVRRFGLAFFFYGFMAWVGFFFTSFLHATFSDLPRMLLGTLVGTVVVLGLSVSVLRTSPHRTLARVARSLRALARRLGAACAAVVTAADRADRDRAARRVLDLQAAVHEAVLMSDGWAAHSPALPDGWSAPALRRRLIDLQVGLDRLADASAVLATADHVTRRAAAALLDDFASGSDTATAGCALLDATVAAPDAVQRAAARLVSAVTALTKISAPPQGAPAADDMPYEPAAALSLGVLPGPASVAGDVELRGRLWRRLSRLRFTTRQALQVTLAGALAIVAGMLVNPERYYWAVIAAFVAFTGTGTRFETVRKSANRVLGTLAGLVAGIGLAMLTTGDVRWSLAIIVVSIFCGFYLVRVSYAYMIFFVTIIVSQLYGILGEFSDALLLTRLVETAVGGAIGVVVALVVAPVSTRDAVALAERGVLDELRELVAVAARHARGPGGATALELDARTLGADAAVRHLRLAAEPLVRYPLWESRPRDVRRRLALVDAAVSTSRALAVDVRPLESANPTLASALAALADPSGVVPRDAVLEAPWAVRVERLEDLLRRLTTPDELSGPPLVGTDGDPGVEPGRTPHVPDTLRDVRRTAPAARRGPTR